MSSSGIVSLSRVQVLWKNNKENSPFFCWKEWGMMGSVVAIKSQGRALNSKQWTELRKRRGLLCGSESPFSSATQWDWSTFLPNYGKIQSTKNCYCFFLFFWHVAGWTRTHSLTGACACCLSDSSSWRDEAVFSVKGGPICVLQWWSSSGDASCLSLFSRMAILLERRAGSRAEVSQADWAHFMLVKQSTGHLWLSELIGRLHSSVHWL